MVFFPIRNISGPLALIMKVYFFLEVVERLLVLNVLGLKDIRASVKQIHICLNTHDFSQRIFLNLPWKSLQYKSA